MAPRVFPHFVPSPPLHHLVPSVVDLHLLERHHPELLQRQRVLRVVDVPEEVEHLPGVERVAHRRVEVARGRGPGREGAEDLRGGVVMVCLIFGNKIESLTSSHSLTLGVAFSNRSVMVSTVSTTSTSS